MLSVSRQNIFVILSSLLATSCVAPHQSLPQISGGREVPSTESANGLKLLSASELQDLGFHVEEELPEIRGGFDWNHPSCAYREDCSSVGRMLPLCDAVWRNDLGEFKDLLALSCQLEKEEAVRILVGGPRCNHQISLIESEFDGSSQEKKHYERMAIQAHSRLEVQSLREMLGLLINDGISINSSLIFLNQWGEKETRPPLLFSTMEHCHFENDWHGKGHLWALQAVLDYGADPNSLNPYLVLDDEHEDTNILDWFIYEGLYCPDAISMLLWSGLNANITSDFYNSSDAFDYDEITVTLYEYVFSEEVMRSDGTDIANFNNQGLLELISEKGGSFDADKCMLIFKAALPGLAEALEAIQN
jgi:hypothetical protein